MDSLWDSKRVSVAEWVVFGTIIVLGFAYWLYRIKSGGAPHDDTYQLFMGINIALVFLTLLFGWAVDRQIKKGSASKVLGILIILCSAGIIIMTILIHNYEVTSVAKATPYLFTYFGLRTLFSWSEFQ